MYLKEEPEGVLPLSEGGGARRSYLYLKEEPRLNRMALVGGSGWSSRRKKEWCSTQVFQKTLHWSLEPIRNSRVSW